MEGGDEPANKQQESRGFEAAVSRAGRGLGGSLLRCPLQFNISPVARNDHEEVKPPEEVEDQRHEEFELGSLVVHGERERVRVNILPLHPASPVSNSFPDTGHRAQIQQHPEKRRDDNGDLWQVIAVDVDVDDQADKGGGAHENHPVPLPTPPDRPESLFCGQVHAAMPGEIEQGEHQGEAVKDTEGDADVPASANVVDGGVTGRLISEAAIGEDIVWRVWLEE